MPTMRPRGRPKTIATEVPVTIRPSASEWCRTDTTRTAMGDAIDQNTACAHATTMRDAMRVQ